jgi:hypothetical protein
MPIKTGPHTALEVITPEIAKFWLNTNVENNRKISRFRIDRLVQDIKAGRWHVTGQPIIISSGRLIDGQHRLTAVVQADIPITTLVVYGIEEEAFEFIDIGKSRSLNDTLRWRGHKNVVRIGSIVRLVLEYRNGMKFGNHLASDQIADEVDRHLDVYEAAALFADRAHKEGFLQSAAGCMYVLLRDFLDHGAAMQFLEPAITGSNLSDKDPRLALRRYSLTAHKKQEPHLSAWIKAWNAYSTGRTLQKIYAWRSGDKFPTIDTNQGETK